MKTKIDGRHRFFRSGLRGTGWLGGMRAQVRKAELQVLPPPSASCPRSLLFWTTGLLTAAYLVEKTAPPLMEVIRDK